MDGPELRRAHPQQPNAGEPLARGAAIGRYMVLGLVGRGGMGDVYVAHDPKLARKVAVKLVRTRGEGGVEDAASRMRLLREAQAIAKLSHPNVVVVHDVGTFRDHVFVAMEFVEGQTVAGWLHAAPRAWPEVLAVYQAAGRGLAAAHQAGMVHRDFKPENVMVGRDGQVRVMDFGLARQVPADGGGDGEGVRDGDGAANRTVSGASGDSTAPDAEQSLDATMRIGGRVPAQPRSPSERAMLRDKLTQTGMMVGTPAYMAPEQFVSRPTDARSDQFSFCVALYEGLYGCRPFEGKTIVALTTNVLSGNVSNAPSDTKVPAFVRRILLRGLAPDPAHRWPSMEALLDALARDPAQARRGVLAASGGVLAAALVVVAATAGFRVSRPRAALCAGGADQLSAVWEVDGGDGPRRASVRRAFLATSRSYARSALASVEQTLDRYAGAWKTMYEDACMAGHLPGGQAGQAASLRMACLQDRLGRLKALVDLLAEADPTVVENAPGAASALPALDRCADTRLLGAVAAPPDDGAARARVEAARRDLARVEAMGSSGQCRAGVEAGRKVVAEARALGYQPLEAEALNALARAGHDCLDPDEAVRLYKEALRAAVASRHDEAAVEAAVRLASVLADRLHAAGEARDWLELGRAILRPMGGAHPLLDAWALGASGLVSGREGDRQRALEQLQEALALQERTLGPRHLEVARALSDVGSALAELGRAQESITYFDRARRLTAELLGPDHPQVAVYLVDRGEALNALHLYDEALDDNRRALEIWKAAGASGFSLATGDTALAESLLGLDRTREATEHLEEALRLHEESKTPFFPATRFTLARALWPIADHRTRAVALAEEAEAEYERAGADASRLGEVKAWLRAHAVR
jgi:serine/threonine protein kinase/tetratricopeptide (TPR) repeat protein